MSDVRYYACTAAGASSPLCCDAHLWALTTTEYSTAYRLRTQVVCTAVPKRPRVAWLSEKCCHSRRCAIMTSRSRRTPNDTCASGTSAHARRAGRPAAPAGQLLRGGLHHLDAVRLMWTPVR